MIDTLLYTAQVLSLIGLNLMLALAIGGGCFVFLRTLFDK